MVIQADSRKPCASLEPFSLDRQRCRVPGEMACYSNLSPMTTTTSHPDLVTLEGHMRSWWCQHLGLFSIRDGNTGKDQERNLTLRTSSLESSLSLHYPFGKSLAARSGMGDGGAGW